MKAKVIVGRRLTCSLDMEAVEGSSGVCNIIYPLMTVDASCYGLQYEEVHPHLLWLRNHHMTVHKNPWYTF
jgi:hypothetical protein